MAKSILLAGGTGNLGGRIVRSLAGLNASVTLVVRKGSRLTNLDPSVTNTVKIVEVSKFNAEELKPALEGVDCVISALQGLEDVIVDAQGQLLDAAVKAGVQRFIPSDFALDFTKLPAGNNRNFDLRRKFHEKLESASIQQVSVYNGAFAEILSYNTPLLDFKKQSVGYWGDNPDWKMDFTTMDDTAAFTAAAAMGASAPKGLQIAGFQVSPNDLVTLATTITGKAYTLNSMGSLEDFQAYTRKLRSEDPAGEQEVFPRWQQQQYMHDQFSTHHDRLDNERYTGINWTGAEDFLRTILQR